MNANPLKWSIEADYLQACNCDYGCPCEFEAPPSRGYCEGMGAWRIVRGHCGDVTLDGLYAGFLVKFPGAMHLGNGTSAMLIDERANAAQREALVAICHGKHGGMPFEIFAAVTSKWIEPQFVPFEFHLDGKHGSARAGDALALAVEPIRNPVSGGEESIRIEHSTGFIFKLGEVVAASKCEAHLPDVSFSWPNKAGFICRVNYSN
jgi:hypothetical protein